MRSKTAPYPLALHGPDSDSGDRCNCFSLQNRRVVKPRHGRCWRLDLHVPSLKQGTRSTSRPSCGAPWEFQRLNHDAPAATSVDRSPKGQAVRPKKGRAEIQSLGSPFAALGKPNIFPEDWLWWVYAQTYICYRYLSRPSATYRWTIS
jgi:hypothetical protein